MIDNGVSASDSRSVEQAAHHFAPVVDQSVIASRQHHVERLTLVFANDAHHPFVDLESFPWPSACSHSLGPIFLWKEPSEGSPPSTLVSFTSSACPPVSVSSGSLSSGHAPGLRVWGEVAEEGGSSEGKGEKGEPSISAALARFEGVSGGCLFVDGRTGSVDELVIRRSRSILARSMAQGVSCDGLFR